MRICIFGAGAIGGMVAGALDQAGAKVSVVARGANLKAIRESGLTIASNGIVYCSRIVASDQPSELGPQDLVVVALKAPSLSDFAGLVGPLLHDETAVVFLMNGVPWWYFYAHPGPLNGRRIPLVDPADGVWQAVGPHRAIGGVVRCAAAVVAPGVVQVTSPVRKILVGEPDGTVQKRSDDFRDLLCQGGIDSAVAPDIRDAVWDKLVGNLMDGPLAAVTGARSDQLYSSQICSTIAGEIGHEVIAIGKAMGRRNGVDIDAAIEAGRRRVHLPSIAEDLQRYRRPEIDALLSVPLEWADECEVPVPTLRRFAELVKLRAATSGYY